MITSVTSLRHVHNHQPTNSLAIPRPVTGFSRNIPSPTPAPGALAQRPAPVGVPPRRTLTLSNPPAPRYALPQAMNTPDEVAIVCSDVRALRSRSQSARRQTALALAQLRQAIERRRLLLARCRQTDDAIRRIARDPFPRCLAPRSPNHPLPAASDGARDSQSPAPAPAIDP